MIHKMLKSGKYEDCKFEIRGIEEVSYYNGKFYKSFVPNSIKLVDNGTEEMSEMNVYFYFDKY